jgi:hypothetical protein
MDFTDGARAITEQEADLGADGIGISGRTQEPNAQAGFSATVSEKLCFRGVLADNEVGPAILIEITDSGTATFAIDGETTQGTGNGFESAMAVSAQQNASAGVAPNGLGLNAKEILSEKDVFVTVAVEIGNSDTEGGGELDDGRQNNGIKSSVSIEKDGGGEPGSAEAGAGREFVPEEIGNGSLVVGGESVKSGGDEGQAGFHSGLTTDGNDLA